MEDARRYFDRFSIFLDNREREVSLSLFSRLFSNTIKDAFLKFRARARTKADFPPFSTYVIVEISFLREEKVHSTFHRGERRHNNWRLVAKTFRNTNHNPIDSCARSIDIFPRKSPPVNFGIVKNFNPSITPSKKKEK